MRRKITYDTARDYYAILGIEVTATPDDIRRAYRRCVRMYHPDRNPDRVDWATDHIQLINEAYGVLRQAHLRREYDRLRWTHAPQKPSPRAQRATRSPHHAASDRPWWDQPLSQAAAQPATARRYRGRPPAARTAPASAKTAGVDWLRAHHLGALESSWLALAGIWRSPYAGLLSVLTVLLVLNVAGIVYAFINPGGLEELAHMLAVPTANPSPTAPPYTATPDRLRQLCLDPGVQIRTPVNYEQVGNQFSVFGTARHPAMASYAVELGYLGQTILPDALPAQWRTVRATVEAQDGPEIAVEDGMLAEAIDMRDQPAGFYAVRLRVILDHGEPLLPCDVIIQR